MLMYTSVCKHCKKIFKSPVRTQSCSSCKHIDKDSFEEIINYLKKYPNSNAMQISQAMDIPLTTIIQFIDEGYLTPTKGKFERITEDSVFHRGKGE